MNRVALTDLMSKWKVIKELFSEICWGNHKNIFLSETAVYKELWPSNEVIADRRIRNENLVIIRKEYKKLWKANPHESRGRKALNLKR